MKQPQWITLGIATLVVALLFIFGRTVPSKKEKPVAQNPAARQEKELTADTFLAIGKRQLSADQTMRINALENTISRGAVKEQQLNIYHQLAHFWGDTINLFEPYAWYEAEAARLENSENSLTFAARLFLENLQQDDVPERRKWKALQAKDLFERSLKINPGNDSAAAGLGACYLFGGISENPMEGIAKIRQVVEKDSTDVYAQMMLVKGSVISGQYDKAIGRLQTVARLEPRNWEAALLLADLYERTEDKKNAVSWYQKSLQLVQQAELKKEIEKRIEQLGK